MPEISNNYVDEFLNKKSSSTHDLKLKNNKKMKPVNAPILQAVNIPYITNKKKNDSVLAYAGQCISLNLHTPVNSKNYSLADSEASRQLNYMIKKQKQT
jgi:hypothetical protein